MKTMTPAEMSERTGLSISTLHYYEQIGLLDEVRRADNGHRTYTDEDLIRVEFLKHVRATGMSISQIQHFIRLHHEGDSTLEERLDILEDHRRDILAQMDDLYSTLAFLEAKIEIVRQLGSHEHTPAGLELNEISLDQKDDTQWKTGQSSSQVAVVDSAIS